METQERASILIAVIVHYNFSVICIRLLVDLFVEGLFMPGVKINPDYKNKYIYILAYATTVAETYKKVNISHYILVLACITLSPSFFLAVCYHRYDSLINEYL